MPRALLPVLLAACAADPAPDAPGGDDDPLHGAFHPPDAPGPYDAGVTTVELVDARGKALTVDVWYPAVAPDGATPDTYDPIPIALAGYRDAPPVRRATPWPLLAFSHGLGGVRFQSAFLTEHLASHGFVVVAPDHPGSVLLTIRHRELGQNFLERPDDVRHAVDHVIALAGADHALLGGMVADGPYGMLGHSFGAITSLVLGGGALDAEALLAFCADPAERDRLGCGFVGTLGPDDLEGHGTVDPRVQVVVSLSPGGAYAFGPHGAGLSGVVETLVLAGEDDDVLPFSTEARPVFDALPGPKHLGSLADAGHYAGFSDLCRLLPFMGDCAPNAGFLPSDRAQAITTPVITAFLQARFLGDARAEPWLTGEHLADVPELTWTSVAE